MPGAPPPLLFMQMTAILNAQGTASAATVGVTAIACVSATALVAWVLARGKRGSSPAGASR
jgi:hypothetical protein